MATRSLTEIYILLRNNAQQNRHIYSDQHADDKTALIGASIDVETGRVRAVNASKLPPEWVDCLEEINFDVTRIKQKLKDLNSLHDKHLHRPTLDDSIDEERQIEFVTKEITSMINKCQDALRKIDRKSQHAQPSEKRMAVHVTMALAATLQELTMTFRKGQSAYLSQMQTREERSRQYFGSDLTTAAAAAGSSSIMIEEDAEMGFMTATEASSQRTQAFVHENTHVIAEREREISEVVHSIQDLNQIFRDLSQIVVDQGTILDRIDYNIEQTSTRVEQGLQQLTKAEKYQRGNRKMMFIIILAIIIIVLVIILIAVKS